MKQFPSPPWPGKGLRSTIGMDDGDALVLHVGVGMGCQELTVVVLTVSLTAPGITWAGLFRLGVPVRDHLVLAD